MVACDELAKVGPDRLARKHVRQAIGSRRNRITGLLLQKSMNDHEFPPFVSRLAQGLHGRVVEHGLALGRPLPVAPIIVNDLDVVGPFTNARIHKALSLLWSRDGWERWPTHLRGMAAGPRGTHACGSHVSKIRGVFCFHLLDHFEPVAAAEHIELGSNAEDQRWCCSGRRRAWRSWVRAGSSRFLLDLLDTSLRSHSLWQLLESSSCLTNLGCGLALTAWRGAR